MALVTSTFWNGKRVFVTYPTTFLGTWTILTLNHLGAQVFAIADTAPSTPNLFDLSNLAQKISMTYGDLRDEEVFRQVLQFAQADIILHLGDFSSLKEAEKNGLDTISKTVIGTTVLLELLRETASVRSVVVVGSDKVYERNLSNIPIAEDNKVIARELLPTAKLCSEFIALSYRHTFFNPGKYNKHKIALATARLQNAIGGGDFTEGALIPDAVQSFISRKPFEVRNPNSVRPWIHVLDQVSGILLLAEALYNKGPKLAPSYNLGANEHKAVGEVLKQFSEVWGTTWSSVVSDNDVEVSLSFHPQLNSDLAQKDFGWKPKWSLTKSLEQTAKWYIGYHSGHNSPEELTAILHEYLVQNR